MLTAVSALWLSKVEPCSPAFLLGVRLSRSTVIPDFCCHGQGMSHNSPYTNPIYITDVSAPSANAVTARVHFGNKHMVCTLACPAKRRPGLLNGNV